MKIIRLNENITKYIVKQGKVEKNVYETQPLTRKWH